MLASTDDDDDDDDDDFTLGLDPKRISLTQQCNISNLGNGKDSQYVDLIFYFNLILIGVD